MATVKQFNEKAFVKWTVDSATYFGQVAKVTAEAYEVELPTKQVASVKLAEATESSEAEFKTFAVSTAESLFAVAGENRLTVAQKDEAVATAVTAVQSAFDSFKTEAEKTKAALEGSLTKAQSDLVAATNELASLKKVQAGMARFDELASLKALAFVSDETDKDKLTAVLANMTDSEYAVRREMAAKFARTKAEDKPATATEEPKKDEALDKEKDMAKAAATLDAALNSGVVEDINKEKVATVAAATTDTNSLSNAFSQYFSVKRK